MESEKIKEIKKAIEWRNVDVDCNGCPYYAKKDCIKIKNNDILTLINKLESDNERLSRENTIRQNLLNEFREENGRLYDDIHKKGMQGLKKENKELKDRIAELEKENDSLKGNIVYREKCEKELVNACDKCNSKIEKFGEILKEKAEYAYLANYDTNDEPFIEKPDFLRSVDEALKECLNEKPTE